jgi:hypothetical protein
MSFRSRPIPAIAEAFSENELIMENINSIEDEDPEAGMTASWDDNTSIYTFVTARTSNSIIFSLEDDLLQQESCPLDSNQLSTGALPNVLNSGPTWKAAPGLIEGSSRLQAEQNHSNMFIAIPIAIFCSTVMFNSDASHPRDRIMRIYSSILQISTGNILVQPLPLLLASVTPTSVGTPTQEPKSNIMLLAIIIIQILQRLGCTEWFRNRRATVNYLALTNFIITALLIIQYTWKALWSDSTVIQRSSIDQSSSAVEITPNKSDSCPKIPVKGPEFRRGRFSRWCQKLGLKLGTNGMDKY